MKITMKQNVQNKFHNSKIQNVFSIFIHIQYHEGVFFIDVMVMFSERSSI